MAFQNIIVKNTNINRELRHQSNLLENLFKANFKEFERLWYPMSFDITLEASKAVLTTVGIKHEFPFSYYIKDIAVLTSVNSLAGVALEINNQLHPVEGFTVATTASTATTATVYRGNATIASIYKFNKFVDKPFNLQLHYINTHGSAQIIYLSILGFRVPLKQILLTVKKEGVVHYES